MMKMVPSGSNPLASKMRARVTQQTDGPQRRQSAEHTAVGDIISGLEAQLCATIEYTDGSRKTVPLTRGADAEGRCATDH